MTERIRFLREQTLTSKNKIARRPIPFHSTANEKGGIPVRKALALKWMFDTMPVYIGEKELIVGTRTYYQPHADNADGHSVCDYSQWAYPEFINIADIEKFGENACYMNKTHYTPDFAMLLEKGIGGIIEQAQLRKEDKTLKAQNIEFLDSVIIAYTGLKNLVLRYADHAKQLSDNTDDDNEKARLSEIERICRKISEGKPDTFREAIQLLWFGHLGTMIESFIFINYGRLDVILGKYLKDTPFAEGEELIACLLLKMYDQADLNDMSVLNKHEGQLVITLGGVDEKGENAVNDVTMMFLNAASFTKLPEPEINLRISSKNPPEFLDKAAQMTVDGCNFVSYYNDDLFVEALIYGGAEAQDARCYGFDLCQDINFPGKSSSWVVHNISLAHELMNMLCEKDDFDSFDELLSSFKSRVAKVISDGINWYNATGEHMMLYRDGRYDEFFHAVKNKGMPTSWDGRSPMCPLPLLSALYHGTVENAVDMTLEGYMLKHRGSMVGTAVEAVNSLAAIKKVVFEEKQYTLEQVVKACKEDFFGEEILRSVLWNAPKWGNDDEYVDSIAKELLEFCLVRFNECRTFSGGRVFSGIHQPHPVTTGQGLMATAEGRRAGAPVAVTMTAENGTMKNGATAALKSASVFDTKLLQWNYCCMVNYYASVFAGESGKDNFKKLLLTYFKRGGMQHQPNVLDANELKKAQLEPERYKDLVVRLWGVSAHFVDIPKEMQDEMIARLS
ncbi:MAG: hypothetical protein E7491_03375 [Ruminococcaceae bacterium]|nr:hypothetical protein [Oscillospiraceae bacterium]